MKIKLPKKTIAKKKSMKIKLPKRTTGKKRKREQEQAEVSSSSSSSSRSSKEGGKTSVLSRTEFLNTAFNYECNEKIKQPNLKKRKLD